MFGVCVCVCVGMCVCVCVSVCVCIWYSTEISIPVSRTSFWSQQENDASRLLLIAEKGPQKSPLSELNT